MNKYIRTKDGILPIVITKLTEPMFIERKGELIGYWGYRRNGDYVIGEILTKDLVKIADTIEELIQDGDLCHFAKCNVCRDHISDVRVFLRKNYIGISVPGIEYSANDVLELWIKDTMGNYIKVAQKETEKGDLELI